MQIKRHAVTLAAGLLVSAVAPTLYAQTTRVAVVDLQRAIAETEDGRREIQRIKRIGKRRQNELTEAQESLEAARKQFEARRSALTEEAARAEATKLQEQYVELQQKYTSYQRELAELEQKATGGILRRMEGILRHIGQSEGYTLIVDRTHGGVVWVPTNLDLTDELIQRYNSGEGRAAGGAATKGRRGRRRGRSRRDAGGE